VNRHAGPPGPDTGPPPTPEPSYAERARTLVHLARSGTLSTLSRRHSGHPFGSVMPYAPDEHGAPLLLISSMAMHTQNLEADPRASLLVMQPGWAEDPLAGGRVTLMGRAARVPDQERPAAREAYLARQPKAAFWVEFEDFAFWRLEVTDVYFVGGFAAMDWVTGEAYASARPDPLADAAEGIVEHMNRDHSVALLTLARAHADDVAEEATMLSVDRLGFRVQVRSGERLHGARISFPREIVTAEECRAVLIEMIRAARG
jgi:heme oxygenase (biliverdin-IX-beta and delta-forming)